MHLTDRSTLYNVDAARLIPHGPLCINRRYIDRPKAQHCAIPKMERAQKVLDQGQYSSICTISHALLAQTRQFHSPIVVVVDVWPASKLMVKLSQIFLPSNASMQVQEQAIETAPAVSTTIRGRRRGNESAR
jgi:hypothetical protein